MASTTGRKAHRASIRSGVIEILRKTAKAYAKFGDPHSDLRDAPEYLLTVSLAQGLTAMFPAFRYRLEHARTAFKGSAKTPFPGGVDAARDLARFDIVLMHAKSKAANYIFEVKRGKNVLDDAKRIVQMAALESGRKRWRHGFLVTILRRSEAEARRIVDELVARLQKAGDAERLPEGHRIVVRQALEKIGTSKGADARTAIWGAVFHIELVLPPAEALPDGGVTP